MAKGVVSRSQVLESEYESGTTHLVGAVVLLLVSLLALWGANLIVRQHFAGSSFQMVYLRPLLFLGGVVGVAGSLYIGGRALVNMRKVKSRPTVSVHCPYCGYGMEFVDAPTEDYDCEGCHRRVYYENGQPVEIKQITCTFCKTVHKVSARATQYMCDRCNRALRLTDPNNPDAVVQEQSDMLANYDVQLTDIGRNKNEVALALQSMLVCNLPEARRQMEHLPLTIARNVPERKADAIRRRMRELGATAISTPTAQSEQPRAARR
jgi:ribosomal protein L7/L12